jgi:minor extracellular serine protease Vpr
VRRLKRLPAVAVAIATALVTAAAAGAMVGNPTDGSSTTPSGVVTDSAIVLLKGDPLSTYVKTKPAPGKKIDFSSTSVKSYRAQLSALRNDFKQWLQANAPAAQITGQYDISLNAVAVQLNGTSLATLRSAPQAADAQYELSYSPAGKPAAAPSLGDPDLPLISAFQAWGAGGGANAGVRPDGTRVKVAVIDTGIDITSPCFNDAGYAPTTQLGDTRYTNNKVIVAKVFYNKAKQQGLTPKALQEHGTHVSGTIACDYGLTNSSTLVNGVTVPYGILGVAPGALLGNYSVFPGSVDNARSEDILNALEAAYQDGFDVANLSLGGNAHGVQDLLTNAIDDLDAAGMVIAVAAGNSGPGHYTVESPGSAEDALTAGAFTVGHFIGTPVTVGGTTYGAASGDFNTVSADLTAPLGVVTGTTNGLSTACSALAAGSLTGKIALVTRGSCTFSTKIRNAQNAGAAAVLVANNVAGDPVAMAQDGTANQPTVPAYMVALVTGQALLKSNGVSTTIGATQSYLQTPNSNIMAGFSSQGPTDVDFRVKPDVAAPGVNVLSSIPSAFCALAPCWAFFQGTSMATPHLAGSAAVVIGQHPDWSSDEVRSAIVDTADQGVLTDFQTGKSVVTDPNIVGAGRDDLANAVAAKVGLDPVSVSFGSVPSISGQTRTVGVTLSDLTGRGGTYALSIGSTTGRGVSYSLSAATVSIPAGGTATVSVTMSSAQGASLGDHYATLSVGSSAHEVLYTFVKQ